MRLGSRLRPALELHELVAHFQPPVCGEDGRIVRLEALVRKLGSEQVRAFPFSRPVLAEETIRVACGDFSP